MLFDFCNVLNIFQIFINKVLKEYFDIFCSIYLDNILVYNNNQKEYVQYVKQILEKLKQTKLYLNINKYQFYIQKMKYLDLIIITKRLKMDSKKINIIIN